MSLLVIIWVAALLLAGGAIAGMTTLILLRVRHARRTARRAADRRHVEQALIGVMQGRRDADAALGPYKGRARLMAETLLDFIGIVRGEDRQLVVAALASVGADRHLRNRIGRGSLAGRLASVEALGAFEDPETQFALMRASTRGPEEVRLAALRSLIQAGGTLTLVQLLDALNAGRFSPSGQFSELLQMVVERDPQTAIAVLDETLSPLAERLVVEALGGAGAYAAIPALMQRAEAGPTEVRAAAVQALGRLKHPAAEGALGKALGDHDWEVRSAAAEAVGAARLGSLIEPLAARLDDSVWHVRHRAAEALARMGPNGVARLEALANGGPEEGRRAAALALAGLGVA